MKIKGKLILGLTSILIGFSIILNFLIREVLLSNLENNISISLEEIMKSSREYVKYRLVLNNSISDENTFNNDAIYIAKYISINFECDCEIMDMNRNPIHNEGSNDFQEIINKNTKNALSGKAVVDIKYGNSTINGILSFPVYINSSYLGIIVINKSFTSAYEIYRKTINNITLIESAVFFAIFSLTYLITSKITKPITLLTKAVRQVGEGDYNIQLKAKSKDEIGILSKELINMKDKINEQFHTIKLEKEKVEKLEKGRRSFFNNVTHELKTPLTAISGYAEILLEEIVEDEDFKKRAYERIYLESERLHKLVLELISVSKGISSVEEEKRPINMKKLLNEICDDMDIKAKKYLLEIDRYINAGSIWGQPDRIREVVINIIDNAIKYSLSGEIISIRAYTSKDYYIIELKNKAKPIPNEIFDNIFEPFVKSINGIDKYSRGLGLYICSLIVKEHDGEITLENGNIIKTKIKIPSYGNNLVTN